MVTSAAVSALVALPDGTALIGLVPFAAAGLVALALVAWRPPVTRTAVLAIVPWALAAAGLHAYAAAVSYPSAVRPLFVVPQVYLVTFALAGLAWMATGELSAARRPPRDPSYHLVAMGAGAATVVVAGAVASGTATGLAQVLLLPIVVIAAAAVAGAVYVAFGILYTDVPAYTGLAGSLVVFGHVLDGVATALEVSSVPEVDPTWLSEAALALSAALPLGVYLGVGQRYELVWIVLWLKLLVAVLVVTAVARYAREQPSRANVVLGGITAAGVVPGATTLLLVLTGG